MLPRIHQLGPAERRTLALACLCNFCLLASFYILRPVRDTMATVLGTGRLQELFTATFVGTLIASPLYAALTSRIRLQWLLPGASWFWLINVLLFAALLHAAPDNRWIGAGYYVWFSVVNLFMISIFWSLMVDVFSAPQATRLFGWIAAGGELGAIAGPLLTRMLATHVGLVGLLLVAAAGLGLVAALTSLLVRAKQRLAAESAQAQHSTLDHELSGRPFDGFRELLASPYARSQAWFILLMSWVSTVAYFFQTDLIARSFQALESRAQAIADIDLVVNILSALILIFGLGRLVQRFGVTAGLVLNPIIMVIAFLALALAPGLRMIQLLQVVRRVGQYAIARPSREICFTVVEQSSRYKAKNVIDTVVYRFGDLSSAWLQTGVRAAGLGFHGAIALGVGASLGWGAVAALLGKRYERIRKTLAR
jgi:AAA family ATP:ADP antiporter